MLLPAASELRIIAAFTFMLGIAAAPQSVRGDGDSLTRPATAEEKNFVVTTKQALKNGLPALPAGWSLDHEAPLLAEDTLTFFGKTESALQVKYSADLKRVDGMQERITARDKAIEDSSAARTKMNQLMDAIRQRAGEADTARQAGERGAYESAKTHMESLQKEYDALMESSANPIKAVTEAEYNVRRDTSVRLQASANPRAASISGPLQTLQVPGAAAAFRRDYEDRERASKVLVLFGDWRIEKFGEGANQSISATRPGTKSDKVTAVYSVAMEIEADKERVPELLVGLNSSAIAELLSIPPAS